MEATRGTVVPSRIRRRITNVVHAVDSYLIGGAATPVAGLPSPSPTSWPSPTTWAPTESQASVPSTDTTQQWQAAGPIRRHAVDRAKALAHYQAMAAHAAREHRMQHLGGLGGG